MSQRGGPGGPGGAIAPKVAVAAAVLVAGFGAAGWSVGPTKAPRRLAVLLVGTYHGHRGRFSSIQAALDAARPGDWILVAPGDYHERADHRASSGPAPPDT